MHQRFRNSFLVIVALSIPSLLGAGDVVINEIHYKPLDKTSPQEFVELYSNSDAAVDISGWFFSNGISYTFAPGTSIPAQGYLVVAEDPATVAETLAFPDALGPYSGSLSNDGERIVLRNAAAEIEDEVDYQARFPWPLASVGQGSSMELLHPALDNDLGGSWRASGFVIDFPTERNYFIEGEDEEWRFRKGTSEASDPPSAWRQTDFVEDNSWLQAQTSIGFGDDDDNTVLEDMRGNYPSLFLRHAFTVDVIPTSLKLGLFVDDGAIVWINGFEVQRFRVDDGEIPFDGDTTSGEARWRETLLPNPANYLVRGENILAIHALNASVSSSDFSIDAMLFVPGPEDFEGGELAGPPTPGGRNSVLAENVPPQLRQVSHAPQQPSSGEAVTVTVKATDPEGISRVELHYQLVDPGAYIRLGDPEYETQWTTLEMTKVGDFYRATLGGELQLHRRLVRYRIAAVDGAGNSVLVPYPDDPTPNFAYFVYDGIPSWRGASRPGDPVVEFSEEVMRSLPAYHLIAVEQDVINCQYSQSYENRHFLGTMVYDGVVYDHIEFEVRGEFSTYVAGKNKWRFFFNRGREFAARDNYGRRYRETWRTMNVSACATPWVTSNRGMAGLGEALAFKVYDLAGVPSPNTNWFQLRIIDAVGEAHPTNQYEGDLWGLYITLEHTDGAFLNERDLPDGNVYKIEGGNGDKRNQGATQTVTAGDFNELEAGYNRGQAIQWWRDNVDLEGYFTFRAINRAINNMDLREGWNICQYHNSETDRWTVIPWDLDMLYMPVTHWSGVMNFQNCLQIEELRTEYANRARELQDLYFTPDQFAALSDEYAAVANPPGEAPTFVDVDEAMWNYHPRTTASHRGAFYRNPSTHSARGGTIRRTLVSADHEGFVQWIKDFVLEGYGAGLLEAHARDDGIPQTPAITAIGDPSFPIDDLRFRSSPFSDPDGDHTFAAMKWRIAEVTPPGGPAFDPESPKVYEIQATWESEEQTTFAEEITIPPTTLKLGARYRVRVRMMDDTRRWSHWSDAIEFTTAESTAPFPQQAYLRITEIMYHPADSSEYEFIELKNVGPEWIDLSPVSFTDGIEFRFADGTVDGLEPGEVVVVVEDEALFRTRYPDAEILIAGEYSGRLSNGGERVVLAFGENATILDFTYLDIWYPSTDGAGFSLVIEDPNGTPESWGLATSWRPSDHIHGSPGEDEGSPVGGGLQRPGDIQQDGKLNISDGVVLLRHLFLGAEVQLPCGNGTLEDAANRQLLDLNGDSTVDASDSVYLLVYLFLGGEPPTLGTACIEMADCPNACES